MDNVDFYIVSEDNLFLNVKVFPGAGINKIFCIRNNALCVKIKAQAEKGKANKELIKFLSKYFAIPRSCLIIHKGEKSRYKIIQIPVCYKESIKKIILE